MKLRVYWICVITLCLALGFGSSCRSQSVTSPTQTPQGFQPAPAPYRPGELLVKFKAGVSQTRIQEINTVLGTKTIQYFESSGVYLLQITSENSVEITMKRYTELPEVEYAEPNYIRKTLPKGP
jgi:hypothetical protein